ncbi:hypothetical protein V5799_027552 [Amblyomma americanum]|uniref:Amino acid permease/ SLC12A domain-containing protein n=1 Tax=Amblyomma americanum TaxID=6943 RepID=A0AAQ4DFE4_AMBAM
MTVKRGRDIDWARFGLRGDGAEGGASDDVPGHSARPAGTAGGDELFHQDLFKARDSRRIGSDEMARWTSHDRPFNVPFQSAKAKPWWSANFFVSEPVLFGTWDGVFTTCMIHLFGVIVFLRSGWIVVYPDINTTTSLLRINVAGVKWVVRLQFALLIILLMAALDFAVGTFVRYDTEHGVTGYDLATLKNNSYPRYGEGQNWFTVFGVFFPAMTGVFAGINMSDDLRNPVQDVPVGTMAAVGTWYALQGGAN